MIGSLTGTLELFDGSFILINVHDVSYRVHVPQNFATKYHIDDRVKVYTYTHVREDMLELYGFETMEDLKIFEALLSVSGIGPKTAVGVFAIGGKSEILSAISRADVDFFTSVPRLGKKNAQKIIIELKGKTGSIAELDLSGSKQSEDTEVFAVLRGFGFSQREIEDAIKVLGDSDISTERKIKLALKYLGK